MNGTDYQLIVWVLLLVVSMFKNKIEIYLGRVGYT